MKTKDNKFNNIPDIVFHSEQNEVRAEKVMLNQNQMGHFKINSFVATQLMQGAIISHNEDEKKFRRHHTLETIIALINLGLNGQDEDQIIILHRDQVLFLRDLLDARMKHCEIERDERVMIGENEKFNPDSYIAMKFLMLDIREWLIGEVIEHD